MCRPIHDFQEVNKCAGNKLSKALKQLMTYLFVGLPLHATARTATWVALCGLCEVVILLVERQFHGHRSLLLWEFGQDWSPTKQGQAGLH